MPLPNDEDGVVWEEYLTPLLFRVSREDSWRARELVSGEWSERWTTLVFPWTTSLKLQMELQDEPPSLEEAGVDLVGRWTAAESICLQVRRFLNWSTHDEEEEEEEGGW